MPIIGRISLYCVAEADRRVTASPKARTRTGYGRRLPTCQMVRVNSRWRRVYVCIFSNSGTAYIDGPAKGQWIVVDD